MLATIALAFFLAGDATSLSHSVDEYATRSDWEGLERARDAAGELDEPDRSRVFRAIATVELKAERWDEARRTLIAWPGRPDDDLFAALAGAARNSYALSIPSLERYLREETDPGRRDRALVWAALLIPTPVAAPPPLGEVEPHVSPLDPRSPKLVRKVEPAYPEAERRAKRSGTVTLVVVVLPSGHVAWPSVHPSSDPAFVDAAKAAVARWTYEPDEDGAAAPRFLTVVVSFRIQ